MNMNTDLGSSQFDSDEEELEDFEEDLMLLVAAAATTFVFFTAVCCVQTIFRVRKIEFPWHTITWPTIVVNTPSRSILPPSDDDMHTRKKAHWTIFEESVLIQFLFERKKGMTWRATFRDPVFKQAAKKLNRFHEKGAKKTSISCRSKWTRVRTVFFFLNVF